MLDLANQFDLAIGDAIALMVRSEEASNKTRMSQIGNVKLARQIRCFNAISNDGTQFRKVEASPAHWAPSASPATTNRRRTRGVQHMNSRMYKRPSLAVWMLCIVIAICLIVIVGQNPQDLSARVTTFGQAVPVRSANKYFAPRPAPSQCNVRLSGFVTQVNLAFIDRESDEQ